MTQIVPRNLQWSLDYNMAEYLAVKARNLITGQTVVNKDLSGARLALRQRSVAELESKILAEKMTTRTGEPWQGFVEVYSVTTAK